MTMQIDFDTKNNTWIVTNTYTRDQVTADQLIVDFEFLRKNGGRGTVLVAHGVPQEQMSKLPHAHRYFGIQATPRLSSPGRHTRRYRCLPGGKIEPFAQP